MKIYESAENYLETILRLKSEKGAVRSVDIAHHLEFSKPSISRAMALLRENGYITVDKEGWIELTEQGREIAGRVYERHQVITRCLMAIGVSQKTAEDDACRVEHYISEETFAKLKDYMSRQDI
ncbi:MAG: metal-dependent transcriptional regulator [Oscillospiraceae bacterium]|nr:metal-dependent transcriptional regulator [Oscillospiraceae bacterium]